MSNETDPMSAIIASARASLADDSWIDEITQPDEDGQPNDYARRVVRLDDVLAALERVEAAVEREARTREQAAADYALKRGEDIHADRCRNCTERSPGNADAMRAERDRLHDLVRRMMERLAVLNAGYRLMLTECPDAGMADLCARIEALVREARVAIGEGGAEC